MRFTDLQQKIKISPKVLTRELQDLELNMLITRTVKQTKPATVEYSITEYARETWQVVADVVALGPQAEGLDVGDRVVLNPWLSCAPRGVSPV